MSFLKNFFIWYIEHLLFIHVFLHERTRGAYLRGVSVPLNNRSWYRQIFRKIRNKSPPSSCAKWRLEWEAAAGEGTVDGHLISISGSTADRRHPRRR